MLFSDLDLNDTITNMLKMLNRLIGENITVQTTLHPDLWKIMADKGNMEQVIMNLAVNARDAMPNGGTLTVKTENEILDKNYKKIYDYGRKGKFVCLTMEDSGTGMDTLKTFNVSSAAAIVAAACGVPMARHGARALTSFCGTVDILESMGLDVECDVDTVTKSIKQEGIGLFNGMSPKVHPVALGRILSQIRFGSTLNIAASLANPARPTHCVRGVYSEDLVGKVSQVLPEIGYQRGMVVYGKDDRVDGGMDELSITGESVVQEFSGDEIKDSYTLRPEDVGLKTAPFEEIAATGNLAQESSRFIKVLAGMNYSSCVDFTCLNAAVILYVADQAESIREGVDRSKEAIENGSALKKLIAWVAAQNTKSDKGLQQLEHQLAAAEEKV